MKKVLLSLAAIGTALTANAQLLNYGFETSDILPGQTKIVSENWNDTVAEVWATNYFRFPTENVGVDGTNALYAITDTEGRGTWDRVIAFTNIGIQENKAYRITMDLKGSGNMNVALLKGEFNADKALVALNGTDSYGEQTKSFTGGDSYRKISYLVWSPSRDVMTEQLSKFSTDSIWAKDFLRLSFNAVGDYFVDNIKVEEAAICGVTANEQTIAVDFGFSTNAAALAKAEGGTKLLNPTDVTVIVDGEQAEVLSVELKEDGMMYIFLKEVSIADETVATVTFKNSCDEFVYAVESSSDRCPEIGKKVTDFENEAVTFDGELVGTSYYREEANLVSSTPTADSFEWDGDMTEFSFVFNKPVLTYSENNGAPVAVLKGTSVTDTLKVVENAEPNTTLVFKRTSNGTLPDGDYTLTIDNVSNEMDVATTTPFSVSFEVGKVTVGKTEYTDVMTVLIEGTYQAAQPTNGWISYFGGEVNTTNANRVGNMVTADKGVGFYLCQRDNSVAAKLTYGEVDSIPFTLPAADVQITFYMTKWQGAGGNATYTLAKKSDPTVAVATGSIVAESNTGNFGENVTDIQGIAVKFPGIEAGNYILTLETAAGWSGTIVYGFDVKTYKQTGSGSDSETILYEDFANVANGSVPAAGTGWCVYDNNVVATKGVAQSGRNRMMSTGSCSNLSIGFYNRCFGTPETYYLTYGEPSKDSIAEPSLELENVKYSFSWYAVDWKEVGNKYYFQLINAETGEAEFTMDPVVVEANVQGGSQTATAELISFTYVPQGGKYIMKWWMTGESIIGKIKVVKMGSITAYWKEKLINEGIAVAEEERKNADADEFAGTVRNQLDSIIAKNTDPSYHTGEEYQAAINDCVAAAKAMSERRAAIANYKTDITKLGEALAGVTGKYVNLDIIPGLSELYNTYSQVSPSTLENEELLTVQAQITSGVSQISAVKAAVDNLFTKQISNLLAGISAYGPNLSDEFALGWVSKGDSALSDDQTIANELQKVLTACIYDSIAKGYNFSTTDAELELVLADSIDLTGYVANNMIYTVSSQKQYTGEAANAAFPGWNITEGTVSNVWWWENPLTINETNPAKDVAIFNVGANAFKVNQTINNLPVGVYTMTMKTADCSNVADVSTSYTKKDESLDWCTSIVYAKVAEDSTSTVANYGEGMTWRGAAATYLMGIKGNAAEGAKTVSMTIGADMNCTADAAQVDETHLYLTGKAADFDYAAAAKELLNSVADNLKAVERNDAPVAVSYINMAGQRSAVASKGVCLKIERYADGYTIVKKVMIK